MKFATPKQRVVLDAAIDRSVIRGTVIAAAVERREFDGWLEFSTALEAPPPITQRFTVTHKHGSDSRLNTTSASGREDEASRL